MNTRPAHHRRPPPRGGRVPSRARARAGARCRAWLVAALAALPACGGEADPLAVPRWDPAATEAQFPAVIAALRRNDPTEAARLAEARRAAGDAPDGLDHYLGLALLDAGRPAEARAALERAVQRHPGNADAQLFLAEALYELGELDAAEPHLQAARHHLPDLAYVDLVHGRLAFHQGRSTEARAALEAFVTAEPLGARAAEAHAALAQLAAEAGREQARAFHEARSAKLLQTQQFLNSYRARLLDDPADVDALEGAGMAHLSLFSEVVPRPELLELARGALARAAELDPSRARVHFNLGYIATMQERHAEAFAAYDRALDLSPDHVQAGLNAALLARNLDRLAEAREYLERVREHAVEPADRLRLHREAARLAEAEGHPAEALDELAAAEALAPGDPELTAARERLEAAGGR